MATVFVVQHSYEEGEHEETKFIGVYASVAAAEEAVTRMRELPGFKNHREGFTINACEVGQDHWTEGFSSLATIFVPLLDQTVVSWIPVEAELLPGSLYRIITRNEDGKERWRYNAGQVVRCEARVIDGERCLVAVGTAVDDL